MSSPIQSLLLRTICPYCRIFCHTNNKSVVRSWRYPQLNHRQYTSTRANGGSRPSLRLAVVGSGPAGFYATGRVLEKLDNAVVDMYEQLPVPYGLVRFGVAPDHPEVKNCQDKFEETASSPRFNFIGNVALGQELPLSVLKNNYDAILFAYGATEDKQLGIEGESLAGVYSARAFVGWYNGLPEYAGLAPKLDIGNEAVVIGQGNVALDVARFLLSNVDALRHTDVTEEALATRASSRIDKVSVIGRRGPVQASFTIKEVRELMNLPSVAFEQFDRALLPQDLNSLARPKRRIAELMAKGAPSNIETANKAWSLGFLLSPKSFDSAKEDASQLSGVTLTKTAFAQSSNPFSPDAKVVATDETTSVTANLAFRSIGYKSSALHGLTTELGVPFDERAGIIPNDPWGRVVSAGTGPGSLTSSHVPGMYCAGWVKRGPTGVIAGTMNDAFTSADVIVNDWKSNVKFMNGSNGAGGGGHGTSMGWDAVQAEPAARQLRPVSWEDWKRIDAAERDNGRRLGKPREKFRTVKAMLQQLDS